jgi:hypothetical protein
MSRKTRPHGQLLCIPGAQRRGTWGTHR